MQLDHQIGCCEQLRTWSSQLISKDILFLIGSNTRIQRPTWRVNSFQLIRTLALRVYIVCIVYSIASTDILRQSNCLELEPSRVAPHTVCHAHNVHKNTRLYSAYLLLAHNLSIRSRNWLWLHSAATHAIIVFSSLYEFSGGARWRPPVWGVWLCMSKLIRCAQQMQIYLMCAPTDWPTERPPTISSAHSTNRVTFATHKHDHQMRAQPSSTQKHTRLIRNVYTRTFLSERITSKHTLAIRNVRRNTQSAPRRV